MSRRGQEGIERKHGACQLVGCPETSPVKERFCPACGAGPYHHVCIDRHLKWCATTYDLVQSKRTRFK